MPRSGRPKKDIEKASVRTKRRYRQQATTIVKNQTDSLKQTVKDLNQPEEIIASQIMRKQFEKVSWATFLRN